MQEAGSVASNERRRAEQFASAWDELFFPCNLHAEQGVEWFVIQWSETDLRQKVRFQQFHS